MDRGSWVVHALNSQIPARRQREDPQSPPYLAEVTFLSYWVTGLQRLFPGYRESLSQGGNSQNVSDKSGLVGTVWSRV